MTTAKSKQQEQARLALNFALRLSAPSTRNEADALHESLALAERDFVHEVVGELIDIANECDADQDKAQWTDGHRAALAACRILARRRAAREKSHAMKSPERMAGVVTAIKMARGFGFIRDAEDNDRIFHHYDVRDVAFEDIAEGTRVTFIPRGKWDNRIAQQVRVANAASTDVV